MSESQGKGWMLASEPDASGYRRPLGPFDPDMPGFSTNDGPASAGDAPVRLSSTPGALRGGMDHGTSSPLFRDRGLALKTIIAFWVFYFVLATVRGLLMGFPGQGEMMFRRVIAVTGGMAITGLIYLVLVWVRGATLTTKTIVAAACCLPAAAIYAYVNNYAFYVYSPASALWIEFENMEGHDDKPLIVTLAEGAFSWYFFFAAWSALYVAMSYARQLRLADARAATLAREAQDAQLRALRYQINPHFLFNTLNSLSSLVLAQRNETAEQMLMNLSRFFRTTLTADPTADVPLAEEIGLQRLYLEIEQIRFPERLLVEIDVPGRLATRKVPVLILQPIVENAVKYGVARARRAVTIRITATEEAGRLHIKVKDDGDPVDFADSGGGTGVGLANVAARLEARFGTRAGLIHGSEPGGGYTVHIYFPVSDQ